MSMKNDDLLPKVSRELVKQRAALEPEIMEAWNGFNKAVFKDGALDEKTKQLIAVAVAHTTQCPYCIRSHTKDAMRKGASKEEIMEAIWWLPKCVPAVRMHMRWWRLMRWGNTV